MNNIKHEERKAEYQLRRTPCPISPLSLLITPQPCLALTPLSLDFSTPDRQFLAPELLRIPFMPSSPDPLAGSGRDLSAAMVTRNRRDRKCTMPVSRP